MIISAIYKIQSNINPKRIYIGSAINVYQRWKLHLQTLEKRTHRSKKLQYHYNKYGKSDFIFSIILYCNKEDLIINEQHFIDLYNPYFNSCKIAGSQLGMKRSDKTKDKMSKSKMGHKYNLGSHLSEERKNHLSKINKGNISGIKNPNYGKFGSNNPRYGKHHTQETKELMRKSHLYKKQSSQHIANRIKAITGKTRTKEFCENQRLQRLGIKRGKYNKKM